jgi:hypothetical protein
MIKKYLICSLTLCSLLLSIPVRAEMHALIMSIGDYQGGIQQLKGVKHDVASALSIAHLLGVKDENILQYHDGQLDFKGMQQAFDKLDRSVADGDKVFIYYSGHGGRWHVSDPVDRCAESLVTVNGDPLLDAELETRLKKLSGRTQKIIVLLDSCHSGGVTTRGIKNATYTAKFWSKDASETCEKPVNMVTRGIKLASQTAGSGGNNYVYIAAAKDNEVSLDQPNIGGMATTAWLACMQDSAADTDGSGGLTVEEIQVCTQNKIDLQMKGVQGFSVQHINVTGNAKLRMTLASKNTDNVAAPVVEATVGSGAPATLQDIYNGRDDMRVVEIMLAQDKLKIGKDNFSFNLRSTNAGYVYLFMAGSDGKTFDLLFPNKLDADNRIQAGQAVQFPRPGWEITAQGPVGHDHILAIVADAPRDLSKFPVANAGPFSEVDATQSGKRGIQLVTSSSASQAECGATHTRNLAVKQVCSDVYGAALVKVSEVE